MTAIWHLHLLGGVRAEPLQSDLTPIARFRTLKAASLLAYLATHPEPQPREVLMALLWPDVPPEAARNSLSVALSSLRHHLEPPGMSPGAVLEASRHAIGLRTGAVTTDVERFLAAERAAHAPGLPSPERRARLQRAVECYEGPFLPGFYDDWALAQRETLGQMFSTILGEFARILPPEEANRWMRHVSLRLPDSDIDAIEPPASPPRTVRRTETPSDSAPATPRYIVTEIAMRATDLPPDALTGALHQHQGSALLDGTFLFGRASDALSFTVAMQRACSKPVSVAVVTRQTGEAMTPAQTAGSLLERVTVGHMVCDEATAVLARNELPDGIQLIDQGRWRLPDTGTIERLYTIHRTGAPVQDGSLPLQGAVHLSLSTLPGYPTRFFGRENERRQLHHLLEESRLVTVLGLGGLGKTRLALETLHARAANGETCCMVPLVNVTEGTAIADAIHSALALPAATNPRDQVVEALCARPTILLLDNLEQMGDSASETILWLLESVPSLRILATSRRALAVPGERLFSLMPLSLGEEATDPLALLRNSPAVALFCDRAQAVLPDFQLTTRNAEAVVSLCRRLDGIPLALEIAASRARVLTPGQWLERLEKGLDAVTTTARAGIPERHRTLLTTLRWSFDLLPPETQAFFPKLSVFQGGWSLEAVEAITADPLALDHLATLGENSLIWSESTRDNELRFQMLETIRDFCGTVGTGDREILRRAHAAYFAGAAAERAQSLKKGATLERAHRWFDQEQANLRAALEFTETTDPPRMLALAASIGRFWEVRGAFGQALEWLERALKANPTESPETDRDRATVHMILGNIRHNRGEYDPAQRHLSESLRLREAAGDDQGAAMALNNLSLIASQRKDYETARRLMERVIAIHRQGGSDVDAALTLINLANLYAYTGDWGEAERFYREAVPVLERHDHQQGLGTVYANLCACAANRGDLDEAERWARESVTIKERQGDRYGLAQCLDTLAEVQFLRGDAATAEANLCRSIDLLREAAAWRTVPYALLHRAQRLCEANPRRAVQLLAAADKIQQEDGGAFPPYQATTFQSMETTLRTELGEEVFAAEWAVGGTLTRNQAVDLAITP